MKEKRKVLNGVPSKRTVHLDEKEKGIECPKCKKYNYTSVTDSRTTDNGIRRRRKCLKCHHAFTTKEQVVDSSRKEIKP